MENLHLKFEGLSGNEIILREGVAAPPAELPIGFSFSGDLKCVRAYMDVHKGTTTTIVNLKPGEHLEVRNDPNVVDPNRAVITVDTTKGEIKLQTDPSVKYGNTITGTLTKSDELKMFAINPESPNWVQKSLIKLLRFTKAYFPDKSENEALLDAVNKLAVKTQTELESTKDTRGNVHAMIDKKVTWAGPITFKLCLPIYKGFEKRTFVCDVCIDATDGGVRFWFESVELEELMITECERLMKEQLQGLSDYVVMYK